MPKLPSRFSAYPIQVTLDGAGNGALAFQAVGDNVRITNISVRVATAIAQATVTVYKQLIGPPYRISGTNSGSTGDNAGAAVDLMDGERLYVVWAGGDPGAVATATFSGHTIPLHEQGTSQSIDWTNPIAAGDGSLIYPSIKSPDYVHGESGWAINRDGSAEFNSVSVRGTLHVDGPGISAIDLYVRSVEGANGVYIPVMDYTVDNDTYSKASLYAYEDPPYVYYVMEGATNYNNPGQLTSKYILRSDASDGTDLGNLAIIDCDNAYILRNDAAGNIIPNGTNLGVYGSLSATGAISADTFLAGPGNSDTGRGFVYAAYVTSASSSIGAAETIVFNSGSLFRKNRAYRVTIRGRVTVATATGAPYFRFRKTDAAGQILCDLGGVWCGTTGANYNVTMSGIFTVGAADINTAWCATMFASSTWTAVFGNPRSVHIEDIGKQSDFSGFPVLV